MLKYLKELTGDDSLTVYATAQPSEPGRRRKPTSRRKSSSIACTTSQAMMPKMPINAARL
jgi:hypothetical protein